MTSTLAYHNASPELRAAMIKDDLLHVNAQLERLGTELRRLNLWLEDYPAQNTSGKVASIHASTFNIHTDFFNDRSDSLIDQIISTTVKLDGIKHHLKSKPKLL